MMSVIKPDCVAAESRTNKANKSPLLVIIKILFHVCTNARHAALRLLLEKYFVSF